MLQLTSFIQGLGKSTWERD